MLIRFLWKMLSSIWKLVTSRVFIVGVLIIIQAVLLFVGIFYLNEVAVINEILTVLSWFMVAYILSRADNPMYKLAWIIPILIFPVFGGVFYVIFGRIQIPQKRRIRINAIIEKSKAFKEKSHSDISTRLEQEDLRAYKMSQYIENRALAPVYQGTYTEFLTPGEQKFEVMLAELKKAKRFIFLEYFIIEYGTMWDQILAILCEKITEGVLVRIMYDDLGSVTTLPLNFPQHMAKLGIETRSFNRFRASLDVFMNHRDHRKICVIDGNVGITGGINIGDEYINAKVRFGHWKDSAILLKGDAVWNLTVMFLQMWEQQAKEPEETNYQIYLPTEHYPNDGYVQPFGDSPLDGDLTGEISYVNIITNAQRYVYISTPYLILDNEMITSLVTAAQSGIEVRIVTPFVPDKWFIHAVTRANYLRLVRGGVHIHEYTPGFIHAKTIVSDDKYAIVGTTNFDFRSFYLHFECGTILYHTQSVLQVRDDYYEILSLSQEITQEDCENVNLLTRIFRSILAIFSPLM